MTKFKTMADIVAYKGLALWPVDTAYHIDVGVDYNSTPTKPHVLVTFYPHVAKWRQKKPSGVDQHWHVPLNKRQATMLRDWLNKYLAE